MPRFCTLALAFALSMPVAAQPGQVLAPGDLVVVGYRSDTVDQFTLAALVDIASGTEVFIGDRGVNEDGTLAGGESVRSFTTQRDITAGELFLFEDGAPPTYPAAFGEPTTSSTSFLGLATGGDQVIVYQENAAGDPLYIYALSTTPFLTPGSGAAVSSSTTYLPTGLTNGFTAIDLDPSTEADGAYDNVDYDRANGTTGTKAQLLALVADGSNYILESNGAAFVISTTGFAVTPDAGGGQTVTQTPDDVAGYRLLSVPVLGYTVADLADLNLVQGVAGQYPEAEDNVFTSYAPTTTDANDDTYVPAGSTADLLEPGVGFFWYLYDNDVVPNPASFGGGTSRSYDLATRPFTATGPVNESTVTLSFSESANGFYMIGNPFGQTFETNNLSHTGAGFLATTLQAYSPTTGYQPITIAAGTYLATWQGVFAQVSEATGPADFTFTYDPADAGHDATFYGRQARTVLTLALDGTLASGTAVHDRAAWLDFSESGTPGWDRYDASKLIPPATEYALIAPVGTRDGQAHRQAVLSLGRDLAGPIEVPLGFRTTGVGTFAITPEGLAALPSGWVATLVDHAADTRQPLADGVPVSFDASPGDWSDRFTIVLASASTADEPTPASVEVSEVRPNPARGSARLVVRVARAERLTAQVFDALGRQVATAFDGTLAAGSELGIDVPTGLAPGLYVVRVQGATFSQSRTFVVAR